MLNWSGYCIITTSKGIATFNVNSAKLKIPVVTLTGNGKQQLIEQLKSGVEQTASWNRYSTKTLMKQLNVTQNMKKY